MWILWRTISLVTTAYLTLAQEQVQPCTGQSCFNAILPPENDDSLSEVTLLQTKLVHPVLSTINDTASLQELLNSSLAGVTKEMLAMIINQWLERQARYAMPGFSLVEHAEFEKEEGAEAKSNTSIAKPHGGKHGGSKKPHGGKHGGKHGVHPQPTVPTIAHHGEDPCVGIYSTIEGNTWSEEAVTLRLFMNESNSSQMLVKLNFEYGDAHCCTIEGNYLQAATWNATIDCTRGTIEMNTDNPHRKHWTRVSNLPHPPSSTCAACAATWAPIIRPVGQILCQALEMLKDMINFPECGDCRQVVLEASCPWPGMYFGDENPCIECTPTADPHEAASYAPCTPDPMYGGLCVAELAAAKTASSIEAAKELICGTTKWCSEYGAAPASKVRVHRCM